MTSDTITTAHAPLAPVITPPRPPKSAATPPMITVVQTPTKGFTPHTNANETASGIIARLHVSPASAF